MIIKINKPDFINIMKNKELELPKRWDGKDFYKTLEYQFDKYLYLLSIYIRARDVSKVRTICNVKEKNT